MKKIWKRNAVVAVVLLFVCAAVYLNWRYVDGGEQAGKMLGESTLVSGQGGEDGGSSAEVSGNVDEAGVYAGDDYFATARLTRQQARDNAKTLLQEAAEQESADQDVRNEASAGIQVLASYTMKEAQIENLVTAKGYTDCVAFMGADSISIVVEPKEERELSAEDVAKITDIAITETGYKASQIKIMEAN